MSNGTDSRLSARILNQLRTSRLVDSLDDSNLDDIRRPRGPITPPDIFKTTNLDLEDNRPSGGPLNDPASRFVHKFTPRNTYAEFIKRYR